MSDLSATQCGCNRDTREGNNNGCCSLIWLIILFSICGNNDGCGCGGGSGLSLFNNNSDSGCGCNSLIWLLLLSSCCGGSIF